MPCLCPFGGKKGKKGRKRKGAGKAGQLQSPTSPLDRAEKGFMDMDEQKEKEKEKKESKRECRNFLLALATFFVLLVGGVLKGAEFAYTRAKGDDQTVVIELLRDIGRLLKTLHNPGVIIRAVGPKEQLRPQGPLTGDSSATSSASSEAGG